MRRMRKMGISWRQAAASSIDARTRQQLMTFLRYLPNAEDNPAHAASAVRKRVAFMVSGCGFGRSFSRQLVQGIQLRNLIRQIKASGLCKRKINER